MAKSRIVVIGAGSASFGLVNLSAIMRTDGLRGCELCLIDIDEKGLSIITKLAHRLNKEWDAGFTVYSSTNRLDYLEDADFIILSVAIDREKCWKSDVDIAMKYGIHHYGENGGPGALMHTARNVSLIMPILRDIEKYAPNALVLNFTNPVPRICALAAKYTKVNMVGICHQINFGYLMASVIFNKEYGFDVPDNYKFRWDNDRNFAYELISQAKQRFDIKAAGINHFTWILSMIDRETKQEILPLFKTKFLNDKTGFEPFTRSLIEVTGEIVVSGDAHNLEYLPFTHNINRQSWERYDIQMYPLEHASHQRDDMWAMLEELSKGNGSIDILKDSVSERAESIIDAIINHKPMIEIAVNIPNKGHILNLPEAAIIEVPALIDASGIHGIAMKELPKLAAEFCRREAFVVDLCIDAAISMKKSKFLEALLADNMIDDIEVAKNLLNDYLEANVNYFKVID